MENIIAFLVYFEKKFIESYAIQEKAKEYFIKNLSYIEVENFKEADIPKDFKLCKEADAYVIYSNSKNEISFFNEFDHYKVIFYNLDKSINRILYYKNNLLDTTSTNEPAEKYDALGNILCKKWYLKGMNHMEENPAKITYYKGGGVKSRKYVRYGIPISKISLYPSGNVKNKIVFKEGKIKYFDLGYLAVKTQIFYNSENEINRNSEEGPSLIKYNEKKEIKCIKFYENGKIHRSKNKPAVVNFIYEDGKIKMEECFHYIQGKCIQTYVNKNIQNDFMDIGKYVLGKPDIFRKSESLDKIKSPEDETQCESFEAKIKSSEDEILDKSHEDEIHEDEILDKSPEDEIHEDEIHEDESSEDEIHEDESSEDESSEDESSEDEIHEDESSNNPSNLYKNQFVFLRRSEKTPSRSFGISKYQNIFSPSDLKQVRKNIPYYRFE